MDYRSLRGINNIKVELSEIRSVMYGKLDISIEIKGNVTIISNDSLLNAH